VINPVELVIFDCDGVLVDSERIAVRVNMAIGAQLGWPISEAEVIDKFIGRSAGRGRITGTQTLLRFVFPPAGPFLGLVVSDVRRYVSQHSREHGTGEPAFGVLRREPRPR
jgi:phosphoglycolate phosphatase-like HAD superfamily hydrolase